MSNKVFRYIIISIHENIDWFYQEVGMNHTLINNAAWSEVDALIIVNKKDVPVLQRYKDQVYAIPNGFSPAFHPIDTNIAREQLGLPKDGKIIFTLGNLIKRKGFNYLIDAMGQVCCQRDDVICFIGKRGPERDNLQKQIDQLHLGDKVKLLGSLPGDQLTFWMNACDFFVLASLNEGNPTVMFEALGCGKAFVGTKVGGVAEIIKSDDYGLTVEPTNSYDLAENILKALEREWDRGAILTYAEQFTWENISKAVLNLYDRLLYIKS
ncbi:glycosyltransferase [Methanogenium marinum]|uniref:Glycosyltransferase n=1 Tax=Methanogenium marinum TaxID=348610 RepID=A0A9Q4KRK0_9EURY|nr:glycosyltransferase [Methanogenium marinum]MDE4907279.1 glycosyltransferase [Methanogenium marinum]